MREYIDTPFAVALLLACAWTTLFSLTTQPRVRGFRNLGILAPYVLLLVFLFVAGWRQALFTWAVFGLAGGMIYLFWELIQRLHTAAGEEKPAVSLLTLVHGLFAWPLMAPEAIEYSLAEFGILSNFSSDPVGGRTAAGAAPNPKQAGE